MVLLESLSIPLNSTLPRFSAEDPTGASWTSEQCMGDKGLLIVFTCNHCPYAKAIWPRTIDLAKKAKQLGINTIAINPNIHPDYPEDSAENMAKKIEEWGIPFPYLVDADQSIASSYKAQCTPDLYLLRADMSLYYHGQLDDNWQDESQVSKQYLKEAIESLASGQAAPEKQFPSIGCSIKWLSS